MRNYTKEITPEMVKTVSRLEKENFENATPEDIRVYGEWMRLNALQDAEFQDARRMREEKHEQDLKLGQEQAEASLNALNALTELAQAKLKAVENGQEKQG
jgi:hypothetical protein